MKQGAEGTSEMIIVNEKLMKELNATFFQDEIEENEIETFQLARKLFKSCIDMSELTLDPFESSIDTCFLCRKYIGKRN